jgi:hypothetical protein
MEHLDPGGLRHRRRGPSLLHSGKGLGLMRVGHDAGGANRSALQELATTNPLTCRGHDVALAAYFFS